MILNVLSGYVGQRLLQYLNTMKLYPKNVHLQLLMLKCPYMETLLIHGSLIIYPGSETRMLDILGTHQREKICNVFSDVYKCR